MMTLPIFTHRSKLENDSHRENLSLVLYFPLRMHQLLCDQSKAKVFSSQTPPALIIMIKITSNTMRRESSEDVEYLQMEKGGEYEGVNLRVLSSG